MDPVTKKYAIMAGIGLGVIAAAAYVLKYIIC